MDAKGYSAFGASHYKAGRLREALEAYDAALHADPDSVIDRLNRGSVLGDLGSYEEALVTLRDAEPLVRERAPDLAAHFRRCMWSVLARYGTFCSRVGEAQKSVALLSEASALFPADLATAMSRVFALNYVPDVTPAQIRSEAESFAAVAAGVAGAPLQHRRHDRHARLRVGFVSADFRMHPVARFLRPLAGLDHRKFELFAYYAAPLSDAYTDQFRSMLPNWRDIAASSDEAVVNQVLADEIDILVDLSGYSGGGRMGVFARRPAPVQVTWLGYFATTGLPTMDYVLASDAVLPPADEVYWCEKPWRLPETYICFSSLEPTPDVADTPALRNGYVTFGSFNNASKLTPEVLQAWARILEAVPGSRLVLRSSLKGFSQGREDWIRQSFIDRGIAIERLDLLPTEPNYFRHLENYAAIDIALDTFPFAGATTTCEAMWMGVPVVTRAGDRYVARMGENIIRAIGCPEWIAADVGEYIERAVRLSGDISWLASQRFQLRDRVKRSPLGDVAAFGRELGAAFSCMWSRWLGQDVDV